MAGGLNLQLVVRWRLGDLEVPALVNLLGGCPPLPPLPRALFQRILLSARPPSPWLRGIVTKAVP